MTSPDTKPKEIDPAHKAFGDWVQTMLDTSGITQADLARELGCTRAHLSRIVSGKHSGVSDEIITRLAHRFGVPTDDVFHLAHRVPPEIEELLVDAPPTIYRQIRDWHRYPTPAQR